VLLLLVFVQNGLDCLVELLVLTVDERILLFIFLCFSFALSILKLVFMFKF
jgi:hypothetical protein